MIDLRRYELLFGSDSGPANYTTIRKTVHCADPNCVQTGSVRKSKEEGRWRRNHQHRYKDET